MSEANFSEAYLEQADLSQSLLNGTLFQKANLSHASLHQVDTGEGADFSQANLSFARCSNANMRFSKFFEAQLSQIILSGACCHEADFSYAVLNTALFSSTDVSGALFHYADLSESLLNGTNFSYASFLQTKVFGAVMGWTLLNNVHLQELLGLETVKHVGPSEMSVSTLSQSFPLASEKFLYKAGISLSLLHSFSQAQASLWRHLRYYICFTPSSEDLALQLYKDMLETHTCWLASIDTDISVPFWELFKQSRSMYDYLIFILPPEKEESDNFLKPLIKRAVKKTDYERYRCFSLIAENDNWKETSFLSLLGDRFSPFVLLFSQWQLSDARYKKALQSLIDDFKQS